MEKCFPLNDTDYLADDLQMWFAGRTHGVLIADGNLAVTAVSGMRISMSSGHAFLKTGNPNKGGVMYYNEAPIDFDLDVADSVLSRIDSVVVKYDKVLNSCYAYIAKGVPGSEPVSYSLQRDEESFEIIIAQVLVKNGIGTVTQNLITDTRMDESVCGLVRDNIERIPTQELYDQFRSFMDVNEEEFLGWFEEARDQYVNFISDAACKMSELAAKADAQQQRIDENTAQVKSIIADLENKRDSGAFNGSPGRDGVCVPTNGFYSFYINENSHLICAYTDESNPPDIAIDRNPSSLMYGHLILNIGGASNARN